MSVAVSWRSAADWKDQGLPFTTTNDRACKLYDAALTQYLSWSDDPTMGGLGKTVMDCVAEDPNFVMGQCLSMGLQLVGTGHCMASDPTFEKEMSKLEKLASSQPITDREKQHVKALRLYAEGLKTEACEVWEDILLDHPTDVLALKLAHDSYFFLGEFTLLRDSIAGVLPRWKPTTPLYNWLYGMHSFGLEETFLFPEAEKAGKKGLEMYSKDAWATHALAHVYEMQGRADEGIAFLSTTVPNWEGGNMLSGHNYWHWGLYHIEKGEYEAALDIFETQLNKRLKSAASMLDIVDCTSILWRLKMEGVDVSHLWTNLIEACRPHLDDHLWLFNDIHFLIASLGSGDTKSAEHVTKSLDKFISEGQGHNWKVSKEFGAQLFSGMQAMSDERYSDAIAALYPIRNDLYKMGGSAAQRDLYNLALIVSGTKSPNPKDQALARKLLLTRKLFKGNCNLAERLNCQFQPYLQA